MGHTWVTFRLLHWSVDQQVWLTFNPDPYTLKYIFWKYVLNAKNVCTLSDIIFDYNRIKDTLKAEKSWIEYVEYLNM